MDQATAKTASNLKLVSVFKPRSRHELAKLLDRDDVDYKNVDVSLITDMSCLFCNNASFILKGKKTHLLKNHGKGLDSCDVSNVTDMSNMFFDNSAFNQDLSQRDVFKVTNMPATSCVFIFSSNFLEIL